MTHLTRKQGARRTRLIALGLSAALALPGANAFADVAPVVASDAQTNAGSAEPDDSNQPSADYWQIMKGDVIAYLYLPELPQSLFYSEDGSQPPLQSLLIERAEESDPTSWTTGALIEWVPEYADYESADGLSRLENYGDDEGFVSYREKATFKDFYLRATATLLVDGTLQTIAFEPALVAYPEHLKAPADDEGEGSVEPPQTDGGIDGNRGGVGQGESERVNPNGSDGGALLELPAGPSSAYAGTLEESSGAQEGQATPNKDDGSAHDEASDSARENGTGRSAADDERKEGEAASSQNGPSDEEEGRVPGFAWAVVLSGAAIVCGAAAVAVARSRKRK